jgi:acetyl-CoA C-acetyltransferase
MASLKTVFNKNGTITAANASKINDGAATIVLASEEAVKTHNLKPLAKIIGYADAEIDPLDFCIAPYYATNKVLERTGLKLSDIDFFEFNEAFSVTVLANLKLLDVSVDKMNVHGGAVALGHPIGMSGSRIIQSLITVLTKNKKKYGLAAICNGGGGSSSIIIENLSN